MSNFHITFFFCSGLKFINKALFIYLFLFFLREGFKTESSGSENIDSYPVFALSFGQGGKCITTSADNYSWREIASVLVSSLSY